MGQKIRLTESDLMRIVKRVISEQTRNVTVSLDCTKNTINGVAVPASLTQSLCKPSGPGTQTSSQGSQVRQGSNKPSGPGTSLGGQPSQNIQ